MTNSVNHVYKIGDKVVPLSKTVRHYDDLDKCPYYYKFANGQIKYLYVVDDSYVLDGKKVLVLNSNEDRHTGSFYNYEDVTPYVEKVKLPKDVVEFLDGNKQYDSLAYMLQFNSYGGYEHNALLQYLFEGEEFFKKNFNLDRMLNIVNALKYGYESDNSHIDELIKELNELYTNGKDIREVARKLYCNV